MNTNITIRSFTGSSLKNYISSIARLRLEVFREYPYLYAGDLEEEIEHLKKYTKSKEAIVVIVFDGSEIVGASTGIPLDLEEPFLQEAFLEHDLDPASFFFFSESILLKPYRGRGIGHHFFDIREEHVRKIGRFDHICFCTPLRPEGDPKRPSDYIPLNDFWRKRGYAQHPELQCTVSWKEIGQTRPSNKTMTFWVKEDLSQ